MTKSVDWMGDMLDDEPSEAIAVDTSALYLDLLQDLHKLRERCEADGLTVHLACPACDERLVWREAYQRFACQCTVWRVTDLGESS